MAEPSENIRRPVRTFIKPTHLYYISLSVLIAASAWTLALPAPYHWIPFAAILGLLLVVGTVRYPFVGMLAYSIVFFLEPNVLFPALGELPIPYEKVLAIVVFSSLFLHIALVQKKFDVFHLDYGVIALVAAAFVSILGATDLQTSWDSFFRFFKVFLVYLLMVRIITSPAKLKAVTLVYILSVGFLAVSSAVIYYQGDFEFKQGIQRAHSLGNPGIDPNTLSTTLILGIPFMYYMARAHRYVLLKILMFLLIGASLWTVMLTGSRGGMVGSGVVLMLIGWHSRHRLKAIIFAVAALALIAVIMPDQYRQRFMSIGQIASVGEDDEFGAGASAYGRINGIVLGFQFLMKNPLTGIGIGNFGWQHKAGGGDWTSAHSLIGQVMGELGLVGIAAFVFFVTRMAQSIRRVRRKYAEFGWPRDFPYYLSEAIKIGVIMLFVQGMGGHNLFRTNWYFFAAFLVILGNLVTARNQNSATATDAGPAAVAGANSLSETA
jgi:hypothetical protein